MKRVLPEQYAHPGFGILLAIVLVFLIGLGAKVWLGRRLLGLANGILARIPVVRAIYGSARDRSTSSPKPRRRSSTRS